MVLKPEVILERLKELETVLEELSRYRDKTQEEIRVSLSLRWTIERGLIAAANIVFDVTDHILSGHFGVYPDTYEDSLQLLREKDVMSLELYSRLKGLGSFRNVLVHEYVRVNVSLLSSNLTQGFKVFPAFSSEIREWLKNVSPY